MDFILLKIRFDSKIKGKLGQFFLKPVFEKDK